METRSLHSRGPLAARRPVRARDVRREVLSTLRDFLDAVGEAAWAEWLQIALDEGRLPVVGPDPSGLDAIVVSTWRGHRVPPHLVPWANEVLDCLRCAVARVEAMDSLRATLADAGERIVALVEGCEACGQEATWYGGPCNECRRTVRREASKSIASGRLDRLLDLRGLASEAEPGLGLPS